MTYKYTASNSSSYLARGFFDTENDQLQVSSCLVHFETAEAETNTIVIRSNEDGASHAVWLD
jgi:hypothetical protein